MNKQPGMYFTVATKTGQVFEADFTHDVEDMSNSEIADFLLELYNSVTFKDVIALFNSDGAYVIPKSNIDYIGIVEVR